MTFINAVFANWWQFAACFVTIFVLAIANEEKRTAKSVWEITKGAAAIVIVFAFLSGGRGCSGSVTDTDCSPAGSAIYNDC